MLFYLTLREYWKNRRRARDFETFQVGGWTFPRERASSSFRHLVSLPQLASAFGSQRFGSISRFVDSFRLFVRLGETDASRDKAGLLQTRLHGLRKLTGALHLLKRLGRFYHSLAWHRQHISLSLSLSLSLCPINIHIANRELIKGQRCFKRDRRWARKNWREVLNNSALSAEDSDRPPATPRTTAVFRLSAESQPSIPVGNFVLETQPVSLSRSLNYYVEITVCGSLAFLRRCFCASWYRYLLVHC